MGLRLALGSRVTWARFGHVHSLSFDGLMGIVAESQVSALLYLASGSDNGISNMHHVCSNEKLNATHNNFTSQCQHHDSNC